MLVHQFINENKPNMVFIHGVLTPWQIWTPQIEAFKESYNIYVFALNAHTEEVKSEFISLDEEVCEIVQYFKMKNIEEIEVLCGLSLGGKIAFEVWKRGKLNIHNLVLDGAPLVSCPKFAVNVMIKNYKNIIRKSKERDSKVIENFKKYFLPEKYLESYLKIADFISDTSIENIVKSAFVGGKIDGVESQSRILFIHGTRGNEVLSKKSAKLVKKYYPKTEVLCFKGDTHCYKAIYKPDEWINVLKGFLS